VVTKPEIILSHLDSERFSIGISRLSIGSESEISDDEVVAICEKMVRGILILRAPSSRVKLAASLRYSRRIQAFQADTLVYFNMELKGKSLQSPRSTDLHIREAVLEDLPKIESLSAAAFTNYPSHYSSNKRFAPEKVTDGYVEWAKNCVTSSDRNVMVATRDNIVCGFIATSVGRDDAEIILNAVDPHVQQQGIYGNLLQTACSQLKDLGMSSVTISSQITNIRVINAWIKQGFEFNHALNTFHIELIEQ
jgi:ribosomal protein S18 acetylase RimI-like enzyme